VRRRVLFRRRRNLLRRRILLRMRRSLLRRRSIMEEGKEPMEDEDLVEDPLGKKDHGKELAKEESELETMTSLWN